MISTKRKLNYLLICIINLVCSIILCADIPSTPDIHFAFDDSYDQTTGQKLGEPLINGEPEFVQGKHGKALMLRKGQNLKINLPKSLKEGEYTIAFWLKPLWHPKDGLSHPILELPADPEGYDKAGWAAGQFLLSKGWSEAISPDYFYGVVNSGMAIKYLKPGEWTHFVIIRSAKGDFRATYVNGDGFKLSLKKSKNPTCFGNVMWLGSRKDGAGSADAAFDDLKIYSRAVDPREISNIAGVQFPNQLESMRGNTCNPIKAVETPHTKWAKPYAKGKLKVICVSPGQRSREFIELEQRLSMDPIMITCARLNSHVLTNKGTLDRMGDELVAALENNKVDALIISAFGWNLFNDMVRKKILDYVKNGGGLLFVDPRCLSRNSEPGIMKNYGAGIWGGWAATIEGEEIEKHAHRLNRDDEEYLTNTIPLSENSMFKNTLSMKGADTLFRGGQLGKGRILIYDIKLGSTSSQAALTPSINYLAIFDPFDYDYALGIAAKAVLWTAGMESDIRIGSIHFGRAQEYHRDVRLGLKGQWVLTINNLSKQKHNVNVELSIHGRYGAPTQFKKRITLIPGKNTLSIPYKMDRIGGVMADCTLKSNDKIVDWATGMTLVKHGNPYFTSLYVEKPAYKAHETPQLTAEVALTTNRKSSGQKGMLNWRLYDAYQREIDRGYQPFLFNPYDEFPTKVNLSLTPLGEAGLGFYAIVDLVRGENVSDQRVIQLKRRAGTPDDFVFCVWDAGGSELGTALGNIVMRDKYELTAAGVTQLGRQATNGLKDKLDFVNQLDLMPWVYTTHLGHGVDENQYRCLDWADPKVKVNYEKRLHDIAEVAEPYSPLFYSLGDEVKLGPKIMRPTGYEQEAFINHLKLKYHTLSKINEHWGTDYKSWIAIAIPTPEKFNSQEISSALRNEVLGFRQSMFAQLVETCVAGTKLVNPNAKVGIEGVFGLTSAWGAFDYAKLCPASTFIGLYKMGNEIDMVRSFLPENALLGCWYNYETMDKEYSLFGPWHTMLKGINEFGWFTTFEGSVFDALNPDFTKFTHFEWTWEELAPILHGIGKLVKGLRRDNPGVYLLYDFNNLHRSSPNFFTMLTITRMLTDLGIQHDFITGEMLVSGDAKNLKALILAGQSVMKRDVADAVREFVENGGTVIAAGQPATSNGFKSYDKPLLDTIFADAKSVDRAINEKNMLSTHGKKTGKGYTFMFGKELKEYLRNRFDKLGEFNRNCMRTVLNKQKVAPSFSIKPVDDVFLPVEVTCYKDENSYYAGMQRDYKTLDQEKRRFTLTGPQKAHVYNVRTGEYLGFKDQVVIELESARGAMFSFLPYKADGIKLTGLPQTVKAGTLLKIKARLDSSSRISGKGVYRIETFSPTGNKVLPLCRKVRSTAGNAEFTLKTAYNDPIGKWKVKITDIATGVSHVFPFSLVKEASVESI